MLDARIQTMDNQASRFVTKEKKDRDRRLLYQVAHQRLQPLLHGSRRRRRFSGRSTAET